MEIKQFVTEVEKALDNVKAGSLSAETRIHELAQLDSLGVLSLIGMLRKKCGVSIKAVDIKNAVTIQDLFQLTQP